MRKKDYQKPTLDVKRIEYQHIICDSVRSVGGNADLNYEGGGSGTARSRQYDGWDDDGVE